MRRCLAALAVIATLPLPAFAEEVTISPADTYQTVLAAQKGKRVTVRTRSGQETTGTVREVNAKLVVLGAPTGREFFDAVVSLDAVESVQIRTKQ
jgi:hypothetical protein